MSEAKYVLMPFSRTITRSFSSPYAGALEPQGAVLEVGMTRRLQRGHRALDLSAVDQRAFRKPGIVSHAELGQIFANIGQDAAESQIQHAAKCRIAEQQPRTHDQRIDVLVLVAALRFVRRQILENLGRAAAQRGALRGMELIGNRRDVAAAIAVGRKLEALAAALEIAQPGAGGQYFHLAAGIVDVVLARNSIAHRFEQIGETRAKGGVPPMPDVQRARGVGRDEFDQHRPAFAELRPAVVCVLREHPADLGVIGVLVEEKIDESGAGDLDFGDRGARRQRRLERFGELARILAGRLRQAHGDIAGEIAVLRVARALHLDADVARGRRHERIRAAPPAPLATVCRSNSSRRIPRMT